MCSTRLWDESVWGVVCAYRAWNRIGPGTSSVALIRHFPSLGWICKTSLHPDSTSSLCQHFFLTVVALKRPWWKRASRSLSDHREFSLQLPQHLDFPTPGTQALSYLRTPSVMLFLSTRQIFVFLLPVPPLSPHTCHSPYLDELHSPSTPSLPSFHVVGRWLHHENLSGRPCNSHHLVTPCAAAFCMLPALWVCAHGVLGHCRHRTHVCVSC